VTGATGGTLTWEVQNTAPVATQFAQTFNPCLPGSAQNTAVTVTSPATADASTVAVNAWGYQQ
jgi:hypothetical protein